MLVRALIDQSGEALVRAPLVTLGDKYFAACAYVGTAQRKALAASAGRRGESWFLGIDLPSDLDGERHQDRVNAFATGREAP